MTVHPGHGDDALIVDRPWFERAATTSVFVANGIGIGAWAAAIPRFRLALGLHDAQLSLVLFCFAIGAVTAMPLAGIVGTRVRTGSATLVAGAAFALALAAPVVAPGLATLCVAAIVVGAANGALDVLMNAHASVVERRWPGPIMSSFHAGFSLGGFAGASLGGAVGAVSAAAGLLVPSGIALVLVVLATGELKGAGRVASSSPPLAFPNRSLLILCVLALLCMMVEGAVADWSGTYLTQSGVPPAWAAASYAAFSICMVIGRLAGDALIARVGRSRIIIVGGALAACGLASVVAWPGLLSGMMGFGLVGLGLSNVVPAVFSAAGRAGASPALGVAMAATAGYGGFLIGPVIIGGVASALDLRWGMALLAASAACVAALSSSRVRR